MKYKSDVTSSHMRHSFMFPYCCISALKKNAHNYFFSLPLSILPLPSISGGETGQLRQTQGGQNKSNKQGRNAFANLLGLPPVSPGLSPLNLFQAGCPQSQLQVPPSSYTISLVVPLPAQTLVNCMWSSQGLGMLQFIFSLNFFPIQCFAVNSVRFSSKHFSFIFKSPLLWLKMNVKINISGRIILNLLKVMWWLPTDQAKIIKKKKKKEKYTQRVHNCHLVVCPFLHLANIYPAFAVHGQDLRRLTH